MINVMIAGNYKVFDGMLLASLSMLKHCKDPITLYVLTMDLQEQNPNYRAVSEEDVNFLRGLFKETNKDSDVVRIDATEIYKKEFENTPNNVEHYTPYTFLRLLADQMPQIPDKILYIDTDVAFYGNVKELYDIDVEGYEIAGVKDYYGRFFFALRYPNYVNAGVLLFNMKKLRETKMLNRAMKLCATKKIFLLDQTAINRLTKKKKIIARKFNEQKKMKKNTVIRHFSMTLKFFPKFKKQNIKLWHVENVHNILKCHEFDDIIEKWQQIKKENQNLGR